MPPMPAAQPPPHKLTVEEFLALPDPPECERHELLDGEIVVTGTPLDRHQVIVGNLNFALASFLRRTRLGEVRLGPSGVRLGERTLLQPDLHVVLAEHLDRFQERFVDGPPDLVIEVLSPSNARYDQVKKLTAYEAAGVPEYWIVDPQAERVEVYRRAQGHPEVFERPLVLTLRREDVLETPRLPEFAVSLAEVFDPGLLGTRGAGSDD